jgi:hypothetical protein
MATWPKEDFEPFEIVTRATGSPDPGTHTVQLQPYNQTYPTGAVTCSPCATVTSMYIPDSDLDDETHYDIYIDTVKKQRIMARNSVPPVEM